MVVETPSIYAQHIRPYIQRQRSSGRLDWIFNILDGRTEQEDVLARINWASASNEGFLLLPDLNWDRKTVQGLHLLALVQRRDIWSLRDFRRKHVPWLKSMRAEIIKAVTNISLFPPGTIDEDEIKCYVHYQPTYYHFHVHVVHVMLEAGVTQAVGKAFGLGNVIAQLEGMGGDEESGMQNIDLHYFLGEESELWKKCFGRIKAGEDVDLNWEAKSS
jgi:m7GpppX diphosphatase